MNSGKKSKTRHLYMFLCFGFFFGKRARWWSQKMAYVFVQHGIIPHILAYVAYMILVCGIWYANMCGTIPCWTKIYAIFWDRHRARFPKKIPKHRNIYKWFNAKLWIFFRETRPVTVPRFGFFQDSRIRVNAFSWESAEHSRSSWLLWPKVFRLKCSIVGQSGRSRVRK